MSVGPPHATDPIIRQLLAKAEPCKRADFIRVRLTMRTNNSATARVRKILRNLIHAYKRMPLLWDKKHTEYFNKQKRYEAFKKLTAIYKEAKADATIFTVRRKIENLRNVYTRELKKVRASQLTATDPQDVYEPTLWHYKDMSFLEKVVEPQIVQSENSSLMVIKVEKSLQEGDPLDSDSVHSEYSNNEYDDTENDGETSSYSHVQPSTSSVVKESNGADNGDDDIIGKSIGWQLRDLQKKQKIIALKLISDAIYYANFGKLEETSFIQLN